MIHKVWRELKAWRKIRIGPLALVFSVQRAQRVTRGTYRRHFVRPGSIDPQVTSQRTDSSAVASCAQRGTAVVVGVGPGFGYALAERLARSGFDLILVSRNADKLIPLVETLQRHGTKVDAYGADASSEIATAALFNTILRERGTPTLVVYSVQEFGPGEVCDISAAAFESAWRNNCFGAFLVGREAGRIMKAAGKGTIVLVGSTSSILGRAGHLNLAVGKFGQRALAQVMSRELWPAGVHVAHVMIDADIAETAHGSVDGVQARPEDVAASIVWLHDQPRTAWSSEIDLRPSAERFWEHC